MEYQCSARVFSWITANEDALLDLYYSVLKTMTDLGYPERTRSGFVPFCVFLATQIVEV